MKIDISNDDTAVFHLANGVTLAAHLTVDLSGVLVFINAGAGMTVRPFDHDEIIVSAIK